MPRLLPAAVRTRSWIVVAALALACTGGCSGSGTGQGGASDAGAGSDPGSKPNTVGSVTFADAACTKDDWCWVEPLPQGNTLTSVWAAGPDDIWAVGRRGIIAHRNASKWGALFFEGESKENFTAVRGSSANDVWIVGDGGGTKTGIVHSDGTSLKRAFIEDPDDPSKSLPLAIDAVWPFGPSDVWAIGGDEIWHFDGKTWTDASEGFASFKKGMANRFRFRDLWASGPNDLWLVGQLSAKGSPLQFFRYDGSAWRLEASTVDTGFDRTEAVSARIRGSGPDDVWLTVGTAEADKMFHWDGQEWSPFAGLTATDRYEGLEVRGPGDAFVLESGRLLHNDGRKWSIAAEAPEVSSWGHALAVIPGGGGIEAVGGGGFCARWKDGWTVEVTPSAAAQVLDVGATEVYVADHWPTSATTSHVRVRRGDGSTWTTILEIEEQGPVEGVALRGTSPNNVWLAALGPAVGGAPVRRFDGATWANLPAMPSSTSMSSPTNDLWVESADRALLVGRGKSAWFASGNWGRPIECGFASVLWGHGATVLASGPGQVFQIDPTGSKSVLERSVNDSVVAWGTSEADRWLLINGVPHRWTAADPVEVRIPGSDMTERATWFMGASADDTWVGSARTVRHWEGSVWGKAEDIGAFPQPTDFGRTPNSEYAYYGTSPDSFFDSQPLSGTRVGKSRFIATRSGLVARREP